MTPGDLLTVDPHDTVTEGEIVEPAEFASRQEAQLRAHRIRTHLQAAGNAYREIAEATQRRDWQALGYESWEAWRDGEFGEERLVIPREARPQIEAIMWAAGMSMRAIASANGVSVGTVHSDLAGVQNRTPPDRVVGRDGKEYAPSKPPRPAAANQDSPAGEGRAVGAVEEAHRPGEADGAGSPPAPAAPIVPTTEQQEAIDREAGHRAAARLVPDLQTAVATIAIAADLGETGMVTAEMIAACRRAADLLEKILQEATGDR